MPVIATKQKAHAVRPDTQTFVTVRAYPGETPFTY